MGKKTTFASRRHSDIFTPSKAHDSSTNNGDDSGKNQDGHNFHATSKQFKFPASVLSGTKRSGKLDLHNQWLHCIPEFVFTDPHVGEHAKLVDLSYNKLDEVDPRLLNLRKSLRILNLSNNNIKRLDPSLGNMLGLRFICLDNNPLEPDIRRYYIKGKIAPRGKPGRSAVPLMTYLRSLVGTDVKSFEEAERFAKLVKPHTMTAASPSFKGVNGYGRRRRQEFQHQHDQHQQHSDHQQQQHNQHGRNDQPINRQISYNDTEDSDRKYNAHALHSEGESADVSDEKDMRALQTSVSQRSLLRPSCSRRALGKSNERRIFHQSEYWSQDGSDRQVNGGGGQRNGSGSGAHGEVDFYKNSNVQQHHHPHPHIDGDGVDDNGSGEGDGQRRVQFNDGDYDVRPHQHDQDHHHHHHRHHYPRHDEQEHEHDSAKHDPNYDFLLSHSRHKDHHHHQQQQQYHHHPSHPQSNHDDSLHAGNLPHLPSNLDNLDNQHTHPSYQQPQQRQQRQQRANRLSQSQSLAQLSFAGIEGHTGQGQGRRRTEDRDGGRGHDDHYTATHHNGTGFRDGEEDANNRDGDSHYGTHAISHGRRSTKDNSSSNHASAMMNKSASVSSLQASNQHHTTTPNAYAHSTHTASRIPSSASRRGSSSRGGQYRPLSNSSSFASISTVTGGNSSHSSYTPAQTKRLRQRHFDRMYYGDLGSNGVGLSHDVPLNDGKGVVPRATSLGRHHLYLSASFANLDYSTQAQKDNADPVPQSVSQEVIRPHRNREVEMRMKERKALVFDKGHPTPRHIGKKMVDGCQASTETTPFRAFGYPGRRQFKKNTHNSHDILHNKDKRFQYQRDRQHGLVTDALV